MGSGVLMAFGPANPVNITSLRLPLVNLPETAKSMGNLRPPPVNSPDIGKYRAFPPDSPQMAYQGFYYLSSCKYPE